MLPPACKYSQVRKAHASPHAPPHASAPPHAVLTTTPPPPQVEHILHPILSTLSSLEQLIQDDEALNAWMQATYGGLTELQVAILQDFFRFGFDGSGADNFFDAGSCIDGRLTSAWNWCSSLPHKPFYIAFQLTGNTSFDGQFQE